MYTAMNGAKRNFLTEVQIGNTDFVKKKLTEGQDPNSSEGDTDKRTALHIFAETGRLKLLDLFLENPKIVIDSRDKLGSTPLCSAVCMRKRIELIQKLLQRKADPNAIDNQSFTVLMRACQSDNTEYIELLIKYGARINDVTDIRCDLGESSYYPISPNSTALHFAALNGNINMYILLLKNNANTEIENADKKKPRDIIQECHPEIYNNVLAEEQAQKKRNETLTSISSPQINPSVKTLCNTNGANLETGDKTKTQHHKPSISKAIQVKNSNQAIVHN